MLSKEAQQMLKQLKDMRELWPDLSKRDYKKMAEMQLQMASSMPIPEGIEVSHSMADGVPVERLTISGAKGKVIFYIHGGAFLIGSAEAGRYTVSNIAMRCKRNVIGVNYTLATEKSFPAGLNDCAVAYQWALKQGIESEDIAFFGESAGGNLVLALALWCKENQVPLPGKICVFSPACDLTFSSPSYKGRMDREYILNGNTDIEVQSTYALGADLRNPLVSPIYGDYTEFPPTSIHVASEEMFYDDAVAMVEKLRACGVDAHFREWEGLCHTFLLSPLPESDQAYDEIAEFFAE
ncbi:MAG TPA: alpha/beta hydrolase [Clostridiales bacterium]|nr:alpha/beta hydrolase [Clostridiales bacterium]